MQCIISPLSSNSSTLRNFTDTELRFARDQIQSIFGQSILRCHFSGFSALNVFQLLEEEDAFLNASVETKKQNTGKNMNE